MARVFLDTNVLVYSIDANSPAKREQARNLLREVQQEGNGVISTQVLQEFYVVATRKLGVEPLDAKRILELLANFEVVTITVPLIEQAIDCSVANQVSFWDALIIAGAEDGGCAEIWTEDLQDGQRIRGVKVVNPFKVAG